MHASAFLLPALAAVAHARDGMRHADSLPESVTRPSPSMPTSWNAYQNPFKIPHAGYSFTAGRAQDIKWEPTTQGTVTIILRTGDSDDLAAGSPIAGTSAAPLLEPSRTPSASHHPPSFPSQPRNPSRPEPR